MSYGTAAYGSTALGGTSESRWVFFVPTESLTEGAHRRTLEYTGSALFFGVQLHMDSFNEPPLRELRVYTHNDPSETPQLQVSTNETFDATVFVGSARFITAEWTLLSDLGSSGALITGVEQ